MKRRKINIVLALALTVAGLMTQELTADAKTHNPENNPELAWNVTYKNGELKSSYSISNGTIAGIMPGDTVIYEVTYKNEDSTADFYLSTAVIDALEDEGASGGAYAFKLSYQKDGDATPTYLYNSDTLGGDSSGLKQIQKNVNDAKNTYFEVGRLNKGEQAKAVLEITLDGNSQDRSYMSKFANIDLQFGVEKVDNVPEPKYVTKTNTRTVVYKVPGGSEVVLITDPSIPLAGGPQTGDVVFPLIVCTVALIVGILLIILYFIASKKQREEVA